MANTTHEADILIIGGGPAGVAAAITAARRGRRVALLDENPTTGGQIWRGTDKPPEALTWLRKLARKKIAIIGNARVYAVSPERWVHAETVEGNQKWRYNRLILATGARERFLPFAGWTLPNVLGAGGLQALAKGGWPLAGKRVVVAGTGPLLLAVADYLQTHGAEVICLVEQASRAKVWRLGATLWRQPSKLRQALELRRKLKNIPQLYGAWPVRAEGADKLTAVVIRQGRREQRMDCDYLACGWHLLPNMELPRLLGCAEAEGAVTVDEWQKTSQDDIYAAGETTGIGGVELSLVEGQIAGYAAVERHDAARRLFAERDKLRGWARQLNQTFALRPEVLRLATPETIVCRCEDVSYSRLAECHTAREAKLYTRCGMGPCQGRICGAATAALFGWQADAVRPPILPVSVATLLESD